MTNIIKKEVRFIKLHEQARLPEYQTKGSSGMDLCSVQDVTVYPGSRVLVPCGIAMELPENTEAQIRPRSGLAFKNGITVLNTPGTIDSDYRGEIKVLLHNAGDVPMSFKVGDRIAQMVISPVEQVKPVFVDELSDTNRGTGGFGSTGV